MGVNNFPVCVEWSRSDTREECGGKKEKSVTDYDSFTKCSECTFEAIIR